jgi:predicted MFS family arabinose efflux permease
MVLFKIFPPETAWRGMFWIGILPAFLVFYIRRYVPEPDVYAKTKKQMEAKGETSHFLEIFSPAMLRTTLLTSLLATGAQGGYYAITTFLPTFLKTVRKLSVMNTGGYLCVTIAGAWVGYMVGAYLADYLGRRRSLIFYAACSAITVTCYTFLPISNGVMLVLGFPLGFFVSGTFSPIGSFFTELFPSRLRGSGQGFAYNFGRGVGALFPTLVGYLAVRITLGKAIAVFGVAAYLVLIIAVLLLPETKGKELKAYE